MRTKSTNYLQLGILITGVLYIIMGLAFYFSPLTILEAFAQNVAESWFDLVRDNELVAPLFYMTRAFAAILFTSGLAMVLPLFDPLRYRGLVYYNGVIFPFLASIMLIKNTVIQALIAKRPGIEAEGQLHSLVSGGHGHLVLVIVSFIFAFVFIICLSGLLVTRKQARQGIE